MCSEPPLDEEVVVIRLEHLGTFVLPVEDLRRFQMTEQDHAVPLLATEVVPVILTQDFLRGRTPDRRQLLVDRFGAVSRPGHAQVLEP